MSEEMLLLQLKKGKQRHMIKKKIFLNSSDLQQIFLGLDFVTNWIAN